jgi:hypothetical protein
MTIEDLKSIFEKQITEGTEKLYFQLKDVITCWSSGIRLTTWTPC